MFIGSILCLYIFNASNYAVDAVYQGADAASEDIRYVYACIFMPTSVINLASGFVFKPVLTTMAAHYVEGRLSAFGSLVGKLLLGVTALTALALAGGALLGIPVLSLIYGYDLNGYLPELLVLILGGGFNAAGIILYLNLSFDGFLDVLYQGAAGRAVMTVCLLIYGAAVALGFYMVGEERW